MRGFPVGCPRFLLIFALFGNFLVTLFRFVETFFYLCMKNVKGMATFQLALLDEAVKFMQGLPQQAYKKILYNIDRVAGGERNNELFKKLENSEIWEFRTFYNGIAYRLFAFWDTEEQTLVIATHGIVKKTQKTPKKEIARAEAIMKKYFELKNL